MDKMQYNNVIEYTLKHERLEQTRDSLTTARAILNNMGVALPQGDIETVFKTIRTDDYMGWKSCTMQEAQEVANSGTAVIGINRDRIVVLLANDEEQPVIQTASVLLLGNNILGDSVSDLTFYQYASMQSGGNEYGATWSSLDAAMNYYGRDFTYTYCGGYYNYYYTFSDGRRMYFRVENA